MVVHILPRARLTATCAVQSGNKFGASTKSSTSCYLSQGSADRLNDCSEADLCYVVPSEGKAELPTSACRAARREIKLRNASCQPFGASVYQYGSGVYITYIGYMSMAWRVGLDVGDRLEDVNGLDLYEAPDSANDQLLLSLNRETVELRVCERPILRTVRVQRATPEQPLGISCGPGGINWLAEPGSALETAVAVNEIKTADTGLVRLNSVLVAGMPESRIMAVAEKLFWAGNRIEVTVAPKAFVQEVHRQRWMQATGHTKKKNYVAPYVGA